jgi:hypothetical protein
VARLSLVAGSIGEVDAAAVEAWIGQLLQHEVSDIRA